MRRIWIAGISGVLLGAALPVFAQVNFGAGGTLRIAVTPANPAPDSTVTLSAESPLLDLSGSDIEWQVDGVSKGSGPSITITLGDAGKASHVSVSVSGPSGSDSAQLTIIPASLDLLWESDSYTPPFYRGGAQVGSGSSIRVLAVPHFSEGGAAVSPSSIDFTWTLNGAALKDQSGPGHDFAVVPAATLFDTDEISVEAQTEDGTESAGASLSIRTGNPELLLYEDNPLFGILYYKALPSSSNASESEETFAAVPYFAAVPFPNDPRLSYAWTVGSAPVTADPNDPSEITINAEGPGTAQIGLTLSNTADPFFAASGSWATTFSSGSGAGDMFHTGSSTP